MSLHMHNRVCSGFSFYYCPRPQAEYHSLRVLTAPLDILHELQRCSYFTTVPQSSWALVGSKVHSDMWQLFEDEHCITFLKLSKSTIAKNK